MAQKSIIPIKGNALKPTVNLKKIFMPDMKISDIGNFPLNPSTRTENKPLARLIGSIARYGVLHAILIVRTPDKYLARVKGKKFMNLDGHRRTRSSTIVGRSTIDCILIEPGNISVEELFNEVNGNSKRLTSQESLSIYLHGLEARKAIPHHMKLGLDKLNKIMGLPYMQNLHERNLNPKTALSRSREFAINLNLEDDLNFAKAFYRYYLRFPNILNAGLSAAVKYGDYKKDEIIKSIKALKPIVKKTK